MKNFLFYLLLSAVSFIQCQSYIMPYQDFTDFNEVEASAGINLYLTQAPNYEIEAEAHGEEDLEYLEIKKKGNRLYVSIKKNDGNVNISVYIKMPELKTLQVSSGSVVKTTNTFNGSDININVNSGANLKSDFEARDEVSAKVSSGAILNLNINSQSLKLDTSSGANAKIQGKVEKAEFESSSGSCISAKKLEVTESIKAEASSGASIGVSNAPKIEKSTDISSSVY